VITDSELPLPFLDVIVVTPSEGLFKEAAKSWQKCVARPDEVAVTSVTQRFPSSHATSRIGYYGHRDPSRGAARREQEVGWRWRGQFAATFFRPLIGPRQRACLNAGNALL